MLNQTLDAYKMPTIADVPELVTELVDIPDEHLTNLGAKGLGEPPIIPTSAAIANAIRDATGADVRELPITREEMLRALAEGEGKGEAAWSSCSRLASKSWTRRPRPRARGRDGRRPDHPRPDRSTSTRSWTSARSSRAGSTGRRSARARRSAELEVDPEIPAALREACASAASPQLRAMGSIGGNLRQATRCWYWRMKFPCYLHGGDRCHAQTGSTASTRCFANDRCASAHPSDPAAALLALGARLRTNRRELPIAELYRLPTDDDRDIVTLDHDEVILELDVPRPEASVYLKAMDRQKLGVPARRRRRGAFRRRTCGSGSPAWRRSPGRSTRRGRPRRGDAPPRNGVQARDRPSLDQAARRSGS